MVALSNVRFGKRNDEVKATQAALIAVGTSIPAGTTGFFGEQTRTAYAEWQRMLGFTGSARVVLHTERGESG
ncbi:peptidoglycan-binding protein [Streptomyces sp. NPDC050263]|uniref:peptidoglycan-binding domain-containing protein n=1 Tax=Streptomyces sp. NPDC050263 TaxID=3155037 RepID=UPI0034164705